VSGATMTEASAAYDGYQADFERLQGGADAAGVPAAVISLRQDAMAHFSRLGFPTTRLEDWRFTNVAPIASRAYALGNPAEIDGAQAGRLLVPDLPGPRLVFVNGRFAPSLSSVGAVPAGVEVRSLGDTLAAGLEGVAPHLVSLAGVPEQPFSALNTAFLQDGALIKVAEGVVLDAPVQVLFVSTAQGEAVVTHPRVLVIAEANSQFGVIESYAGLRDAEYFTNAVTEIDAGAGSVVTHAKVLRESLQAYHVASLQARLDRSAVVTSTSVTLGGALVRNDVGAVLNGEGAECTLNGLYVAGRNQLIDNHTTIDHASPHCDSHELYKGILDGDGRAVFNGKIIVRLDAQKTDAKQSNKALLLSERAQVNTKPQLEILADDVKCTHGATVGQLDNDALFYLRARGLGLEHARRMLIDAFATDVLDRLGYAPLRTQLDRALLERLPAAADEVPA
tara:strand:- start:5830 stop:7182 length:1353 start_codon:yes stop_codon:yes gene_type:complete